MDNLLAGSESDTIAGPVQPFAGDTPAVVTLPATLITGQNLVAGTVLGRITASGKYTGWTAGAADGSQVGAAVLCHDIDATAADKACEVYVAGCFNIDWLTFAGAPTAIVKNGVFVGSMIVARKLYWSQN